MLVFSMTLSIRILEKKIILKQQGVGLVYVLYFEMVLEGDEFSRQKRSPSEGKTSQKNNDEIVIIVLSVGNILVIILL